MYLEERIEQLEHVTTDHGRQIETVAQGLADLTVDVRTIRQDMTEGFKQVNSRLDRLDERMDRVEERMDRVEERIGRMEERMDRMESTLQLIVKLLTDNRS